MGAGEINDMKEPRIQEKKVSRRYEIGHTAMLVLTAMIWGVAFVSQSVGAEYVGTFTFQALRNWLGVMVLVPFILVSDRIMLKKTGKNHKPATRQEKGILLLAGFLCGVLLFVASSLQQAGIAYTTTAKAGFITTLYVIIVPILSLIGGKKPELKLWICVLFSLSGLYLLCISGGLHDLNRGDVLIFISAFAYALQIMTVSRFISQVDGVRLSLLQLFTTGAISTVLMVFMEKPSLQSIQAAAVPILYAGVMSSGIAYTLQIVGQKGLNPTVASIAMCLESVFSAIGGWIILGQTLTVREILGCTLMFASILISQIPVSFRKRKEL